MQEERGASGNAVQEQKRAVRKRVLALRDGLSERERQEASLRMTEQLLGHQWFYRAEKLLCFVSFGSEIETRELIEEALRSGKRVYVPRIERRTVKSGEDLEMEFYRIQSLQELSPGYCGILEPDGSSERYCYDPQEDKVLLLMPGVAFDPYRNRLGYGKGFYDRYLAGRERLAIHSIAVGFSCQMVAELPEEEQDIKPYQVLCFEGRGAQGQKGFV